MKALKYLTLFVLMIAGIYLPAVLADWYLSFITLREFVARDIHVDDNRYRAELQAKGYEPRFYPNLIRSESRFTTLAKKLSVSLGAQPKTKNIL